MAFPNAASRAYPKTYRNFVKGTVPQRNLHHSCGISTIEFALIAPLLLMLIFSVIYFGHAYSARISLTTAVGAVRTGFTRGELDLFTGIQTIPDINSYLSGGGNDHIPPARLRELLASPDLNGIGAGQAYGSAGTYASMLNSVYGGSPGLKQLSETKLYTLVYVNQMMLQSIGPSLRFPCQEKGCLYCEFLPDFLAPGDPGTSHTGIKCSYRPSNVFLDPVLAMIGVITGGAIDPNVVITRSSAFVP